MYKSALVGQNRNTMGKPKKYINVQTMIEEAIRVFSALCKIESYDKAYQTLEKLRSDITEATGGNESIAFTCERFKLFVRAKATNIFQEGMMSPQGVRRYLHIIAVRRLP